MASFSAGNSVVPPSTTRHLVSSSSSSWVAIDCSAGSKSKRVSVFWDLDNKPPKCPPHEVAIHLQRVAAQFGQIVDLFAYGNQHAFLHNPTWLQAESRSFSSLSSSECLHSITNSKEGTSHSGMCQDPSSDLTHNPISPSYIMCAFCGMTCATHKKLKKHYRLSHRREWRSTSLSTHLHGGYGLYSELLRAGFRVRCVDHKPQAVDRALKRQIKHAMDNGVQCICLISDDSDFSEILKAARSRHVLTVVIGDTTSLHEFTDIWYSWKEIALGKGITDSVMYVWDREGCAMVGPT